MDQVTAQPYAAPLEDTLRDLHERLHAKRSAAPPVARGWSEQDDGQQRPLGTPCVEDKGVQRAVMLLLAALCEQDCHHTAMLSQLATLIPLF